MPHGTGCDAYQEALEWDLIRALQRLQAEYVFLDSNTVTQGATLGYHKPLNGKP